MIHRKVDGRMNGHSKYKYCADFFYKEHQLFCDIRKWCNQQWGASDDYEFTYKIINPNDIWCWINDRNKMRIYFATDKEYQWFLLKWC